MSLLRTVYLGAILCGWMAFGGWFAAEILRQGVVRPDVVASPGEPGAAAKSNPRFLGSETLGLALANEKNQAIAAFCLVGAAIGAGLGLAGGLSNSRLGPQALRMLRGFIAGGLGGVSGGWIGAMIYQSFSAAGGDGSSGEAPWWLRPVGWMAAGAMIGLADGLFTLSADRMRNGVIGGVIGGLIGGALFDPIRVLVARVAGGADPTFQFEITSRAAGFVAVGFCIGAAVGLTHVLLKHAWLTVLDGDRPGRQVILSGNALTLGSDPGSGLPFVGDAGRGLLPTHLRIVRGRDGRFSLLPASTDADAGVAVVKDGRREVSLLSDRGAKGISLENDNVITCGRNSIRFNEKSHRGEAAGPGLSTATPRPAAKSPLPDPSPQQHRPAPPPVQAAPAPISPPQPPAAPRPQPTTGGENACPNGHKLPAGQRYCIICDLHF
jgi:hypothetical protein